MIVRGFDDAYHFELFELSPTSNSVMATDGRLIRHFPGCAMSVSVDTTKDLRFLEVFVEAAVKLDAEAPDEVLPMTHKARMSIYETRDTSHPKMVTQLLAPLLLAMGKHIKDKGIQKHTRDDIIWHKTLYPWRRSPLWLLIRVAIHTTAIDRHGQNPHHNYKSFMAFLHARLLNDSCDAILPSDTIYAIMAKLSRRTLKLEVMQHTMCAKQIEDYVSRAQKLLSLRWALKENDEAGSVALKVSVEHIEQQSVIKDTELQLRHLGPYLQSKLTRRAQASSIKKFRPGDPYRIPLQLSKLPTIKPTSQDTVEAHLALADFQNWVADNLQSWLASNISKPESCKLLRERLDSYSMSAILIYKDDPINFSFMALTVLELWVAIDKCATAHCSLIHKYKPGIEPEVLVHMLLPKKSDVQRLCRVQRHLKKRQVQAAYQNIYALGFLGTSSSLGVQYFRQSPHHQHLLRDIEANATEERSRKRAELGQKQTEYRELMAQISRTNCDMVPGGRKKRYVPQHSGSCSRCSRRKRAGKMTIDMHEWPLPIETLDVEATVFELDVPEVIFEWRESLYHVLSTLFFNPKQSGKASSTYPLRSYDRLKKYYASATGKLQPASSAKSFLQSHYKPIKINCAEESNVCVNNGLRYDMMDSSASMWTGGIPQTFDIKAQCAFKLPEGPYKCLQYALTDTIHTSNDILADQSACSEKLNVHEFYSYGVLRAGYRLQWRNIARELRSDVLNFQHEEVYLLLLQAAWQVGPVNDWTAVQESHSDLTEEAFAESLYSTLNKTFETVDESYKGSSCARIISILTSQLLTHSRSEMVKEKCRELLRRTRKRLRHSMQKLLLKSQARKGQGDFGISNEEVLSTALACYLTFDVDDCFLPREVSDEEDICTCIVCMVIIHDHCPISVSNLSVPIKRLLRRAWWLASRLEAHLKKQILQNAHKINNAIKFLWDSYIPAISWSLWGSADGVHREWLAASILDSGTSTNLHFNLLTGSLLIDGLPLSRLPGEYECHPVFQRLFGKVM